MFYHVPAFSNKDVFSLTNLENIIWSFIVSLKTVCFHCWFQQWFSAFATSSDHKHVNLTGCQSSSFWTAARVCFDCSRCISNGKVILPPISGVTKTTNSKRVNYHFYVHNKRQLPATDAQKWILQAGCTKSTQQYKGLTSEYIWHWWVHVRCCNQSTELTCPHTASHFDLCGDFNRQNTLASLLPKRIQH